MPVRKILWPTDFSDIAAAALPKVKDLVLRDGAEVHLLYVAEDLADFERYWGSGPDDKHVESLQAFAEKKSITRLRDICACELEGCPDYHLHFAHGSSPREILKASDELGVDLVVTAKPPKGATHSFGSAVHEVIDKASVPVVAVDAPAPDGPPSCSDPV